jgi:hypothetical protein
VIRVVKFLSAFLLIAQVAFCQDDQYDSLLNYYLKSDSIFLDELELQLASDSMDIFDLIDDLAESDYLYSQLSLRLGYNSDISYAGRTFGFNQFGINGGLAYYHKTGIFADISGYWNSSLEPSYNPTITSVGYMGNLTNKWSYTLSYDHFFYNQPADEDSIVYYPLTNSANISSYLELGKLTASVDYSLLFGQESAHRLRFGMMYTFAKNDWGFIDRFVFLPSASILLGNATIFQANPVYPEWNMGTRYDLRQIMFEEYGELYIKYLWRNNREKYYQLERQTYEDYKEELSYFEYTEDNKFGVQFSVFFKHDLP